jgi:hypothetical protein
VAAAAGVLWIAVSIVLFSTDIASLSTMAYGCDDVWGVLRDGVGSSSSGLAARSAVPDTDGLTLDRVLSAELADVAGVLCDLS